MGWVEEATLPTPRDALGTAAVDGDVAVVGASEAAYMFRYDGMDWVRGASELVGSGTTAGDRYAESIAVSGDTALVGAAFEDPNGAAYVFALPKPGPLAMQIIALAVVAKLSRCALRRRD